MQDSMPPEKGRLNPEAPAHIVAANEYPGEARNSHYSLIDPGVKQYEYCQIRSRHHGKPQASARCQYVERVEVWLHCIWIERVPER